MASSQLLGPVVGFWLVLSPAMLLGQAPDTTTSGAELRTTAVAALPALGDPIPRGGATKPHEIPWSPYLTADGLQMLVLTPRSLMQLRSRDSLVARVRSCFWKPAHGVPAKPLSFGQSGDTIPAAIPRPWAELDSATSDRAFVLLQIVAPIEPTSLCDAEHDPVVRAAGIQAVSAGAEARPGNDLLGATVAYAGRTVAPAFVVRQPMAVVTASGRPLPRGPNALRVYFAPDALGPDRLGHFEPAVIHATTGDPARRDSAVVADSIVRRVWREFEPWRLEWMDANVRLPGTLPRLRPPTDKVLLYASRLYTGGDPLLAAKITAERRVELRPEWQTPADVQFANLLLGSVFLAHGDSAAARAEYGAALVPTPCLRLEGYPAFDAAITSLQPPAVRCTAVPLGQELLSGLLLPGGGQRARGERLGANVVSAVTAGLLGAALVEYLRGESQYHAYQRALPPAPFAQMRAQANATERTAKAFAVTAAGVWVASALVGLASEALHTRWVDGQQHYEATSAAGSRR